jgi:hypothetical protein
LNPVGRRSAVSVWISGTSVMSGRALSSTFAASGELAFGGRGALLLVALVLAISLLG